jgi:beta-phosphoglucomutase-like phosphatase (HAD superfamily)
MSERHEALTGAALVLFDFDGVLVDTEATHQAAYAAALAAQTPPHTLTWSFGEYCQNAHWGEERLEAALRATAPDSMRDVEWAPFYATKRAAFVRLVDAEQRPRLMPGVQDVLRVLSDASVPTAVVTNSADDLIRSIRNIEQCGAVLERIGTWFTRGKYKLAKPHPECYIESTRELLASHIANESSSAASALAPLRVIAFEDSPRGLKAIIGAREHFRQSSIAGERRIELVPVFVTPIKYPEMEEFCGAAEGNYVQVDSFEKLLADADIISRFVVNQQN